MTPTPTPPRAWRSDLARFDEARRKAMAPAPLPYLPAPLSLCPIAGQPSHYLTHMKIGRAHV